MKACKNLSRVYRQMRCRYLRVSNLWRFICKITKPSSANFVTAAYHHSPAIYGISLI